MSKLVVGVFSLIFVLVLAGCGSSPQTTTSPGVARSATGTEPSPSAVGEVLPEPIAEEPSTAGVPVAVGEPVQPGTGSGSCVETYSPENLKHRGFAFDGTITAIELRDDPVMADGGEGEAAKVPWVTFKVSQWYTGEAGSEVGVWMPGLQTSGTGSQIISTGTLSGDVGTRLLVAGDAIGVGNAPEQGIAWSCGFTQPYTPDTAAEWQGATK